MATPELYSRAYFDRRRATLARTDGLTPSMQLDLASSDLDDDALDQIASEFGDPGYDAWGISPIFQELLSRKERTVAVRDITALEQNLIDEGYGVPGSVADGVWDPGDQAGLTRYERDARDMQRAGNGPWSVPLMEGLMWLGHTLPAGVWQGTVGTAKGILEGVAETAKNVGLLGGATGGAALGSVFGPGGALVGGIIGGLGGFFTDLFTEDEGENADTNAWLDALTPFEEYTGVDGGKQFLEDLSLIGSAYFILQGGAAAVGGVRQGLAYGRGVQAARAGALREGAAEFAAPGMAGVKGIPAIPSRTFLTEATGLAARAPTGGLLQSMLLRTPVQPAWWNPISSGMKKLSGSLADGPVREFMYNQATQRSLWALSQRPFFRTGLNAFTGLSVGQLGARLTQAGFSSEFAGKAVGVLPGVEPVTEFDASKHPEAGMAMGYGMGGGFESQMERAVRSVELPTLGPELHAPGLLGFFLGGDVLTQLAWFLNPLKILPGPSLMRGTRAAADFTLHNPEVWEPFISAAQTQGGKAMTHPQARQAVEDWLATPEGNQDAVEILMSHGIKQRVAEDTVVKNLTDPKKIAAVMHDSETRLIAQSRRFYASHETREEVFSDAVSGREVGPPAALRRGTIENTADDLLVRTLAEGDAGGGTTFNPHTGQHVPANRGQSGYFVGIGDKNITSPGWTRGQEPTAADRRRFAYDLGRAVEAYGPSFNKDKVHIGTWLDDNGVIHFDPAIIVDDLEDAKRYAEAFGQEGIAPRGKVSEFIPTPGGKDVRAGKGVFEDALSRAIAQRGQPTRGPSSVHEFLVRTEWRLDGAEDWHTARNEMRRLHSSWDEGKVGVGLVNKTGKAKPVKGKVFMERPVATAELAALDQQEDLVNKAIRKLQAPRRTTAFKFPELFGRMVADLDEADRALAAIAAARRNLLKTPRTTKVKRVLGVALADTMTEDEAHALANRMEQNLKERTAMKEPKKGKADPVRSQENQARLAELNMEWEADLLTARQAGLLPEAYGASLERWVGTPRKAPIAIIRELADIQPQKAVVPDEWAGRLPSKYKYVWTGENMVWGDEVNEKLLASYGLDKMTKAGPVRNFFDTLGLYPKWRPDKAQWGLRQAYEEAEVQDVIERYHLKTTAFGLRRRVWEYLDKTNDAARIGPILKEKGKPVHLYRIDVRELRVDHLLEAVPELTHEAAADLITAFKKGASFGMEAHLRAPMDAARLLTRSMRISGLPGVSDVLRAGRFHDPGAEARLIADARERVDVDLRDPRVVDSKERAALVDDLRRATSTGTTRLRPEQMEMSMLMADQVGLYGVETGKYANVDEFYKKTRYAFLDADGNAGAFERLVEDGWFAQTENRLMKGTVDGLTPEAWGRYMHYARDPSNMEFGRQWYSQGETAIRRVFAGQRTALANGKVVRDDDLFTQLLAVTSVQRDPASNLTLALKAYRAIKTSSEGELMYVLDQIAPSEAKTIKGMLLDIFEGRTIDTWDQFKVVHKPSGKRFFDADADSAAALRAAGVGRGKPLSVTARGGRVTRPKVSRFYEALRGDHNVVVVDTRMKMIFGADDAKFIDGEVRRMAEDLTQELRATHGVAGDVTPRDVQAALWGAYQDEMTFRVTTTEEAIRRAKRDGKTIAVEEMEKDLDALIVQRDRYVQNQNYKELLKRPTAGGREVIDDLVTRGIIPSPYALESRVGNDLRGAMLYGPDNQAVVALLRNGDIGTFMHEHAHLARRMMSDADQVALAEHYGVGQALKEPWRKGAYADQVENVALSHVVEALDVPRKPKAAPYQVTGKLPPHVKATVAPEMVGLQTKAQFEAMKKSIAEGGFREPLVAIYDPSNGRILLAEGHHRTRAAQELGLDSVPVRLVRGKVDGKRGGVAKKTAPDEFGYVRGDLKPSEVGLTTRDASKRMDWTRDAEEAFAEDATRYFEERVELPAHLQGPLKSVRYGLKGLYGALHKDVNAKFKTHAAVRERLEKMFDFDRLQEAATLPYLYKVNSVEKGTRALGPGRLRAPVTGAVAGAALGYFYGDDPSDILAGAAGGLGGGLLARKYLRKHYGYMTDGLTRLNTALRYTLSFTFDAGRYMEQNMIAAEKHGLPFILQPRKHVSRKEWKSPYAEGRLVTGEEAVQHRNQFFDELNGLGQPYFQVIDDTDRRLYQAGMLGFSPREFEATQAWMLYQRGMSKEAIYEAVSEIGRYGLGRTNLEKSINFIFFPFSFQKKLLQTAGDFISQAPGRNLLIYNGLKRYMEFDADPDMPGRQGPIGEFVEKHAPLLSQLWMVNSLANGINPGRFFLQGLLDDRTAASKTAQITMSVLAPSGAATPLAQFAGGATDYAINAFVPIVTTGESIDTIGGVEGLHDLVKRYIPFMRDLGTFWDVDPSDPGLIQQQMTALPGFLGGEGAAPWYQFAQYNQQRRALKEELEPMALLMGSSSADGLLNSDAGVPFREEYDSDLEALRREFPTGQSMSQTFENRVGMNNDALLDLAAKSEKTAAEEAILKMAAQVETQSTLFRDLLDLDPAVSGALLQQQVRTAARRHWGDPRFRQLYDRFFAYEYGPIEVTA